MNMFGNARKIYIKYSGRERINFNSNKEQSNRNW